MPSEKLHKDEQFSKERQQLETLALAIPKAKKDWQTLKTKRIPIWRKLLKAGVKQSVMARWSNCDPMEVSRGIENEP